MKLGSFVFLLIIAACGLFIYLKFQISGPPDSSFNRTTRYYVGKYDLARKLLGLHTEGDAREQYLSGGGPLVVEIVQAEGVVFQNAAVQAFTKNLEDVTGKKVELYNLDFTSDKVLTEADLDTIAAAHRRHGSLNQPNFFVVYAYDFAADTNQLGRTYKEFGAVLSHQRLASLTSESPQTLADYEQSVLLHEFGHQIGLDYNEQSGCVMGREVETPGPTTVFSTVAPPGTYCDYEKDLIRQLKGSVQ